MPLLALWSSNPDAVSELTIEQVVATAGQGSLIDGSDCSSELREYLSQIPTAKIAAYIAHCLVKSFQRSGMVLQDLVNELGRRLDYQVTNGRYQGVVSAVGFDGLWRSPEGHTIVAEVKTTDAYRMSLDTLSGYREKLVAAGDITGSASALIIVGREDTGELEAQVRGSRHAWDIRLISAEALIKLVQLKENSDTTETGLKIRSLLTPLEYTRLDPLVDVMFTTVADVEAGASDEAALALPQEDAEEGTGRKKGVWELTSSAELQDKRAAIIAAISGREGKPLIRKSRALHWSSTQDVRIACAVSKRYAARNAYPYWYAYHPQWDDFLAGAERSFLALGCMDLNDAFVIPHTVIRPLLDGLNVTTRDTGPYWHLHIGDRAGEPVLLLPKHNDAFPIRPYRLPLTT